MPAEDDIIQNYQEKLDHFYSIYEVTLQEYQDAKAEALILLDTLRQDILATISDITSEILLELDQKTSQIASDYEEKKSTTISQVTDQIQVVTTQHEQALLDFEILYRDRDSALTKERQDAIAEFDADKTRVKNLVDERKSDIEREITELFNQFSDTINDLHAEYVNKVAQQELNYQAALTDYNFSGIETGLREIATRKYIADRIRAKKGEG